MSATVHFLVKHLDLNETIVEKAGVGGGGTGGVGGSGGGKGGGVGVV